MLCRDAAGVSLLESDLVAAGYSASRSAVDECAHQPASARSRQQDTEPPLPSPSECVAYTTSCTVWAP